jgi:hypothetical protein
VGGALFHQRLYSYEDIAALGDDIFVLGHYHIDQGIETKEIGGRKQTFVNVGAVSRGSYSEEDISRVPKISFFSVEKTDTGLVSTGKVIRLNVRPYTEVFDVEQHKEDKKKVIEAEAFVAKLQSDLSVVSEGEDRVKSEIMSLDIDKAVLAKVLALLEEADVTIKGLQ